MLLAKEAIELSNIEDLPVKVSAACDSALDAAVVAAIESGKVKVDIALGYKDCPDDDPTIAAYLKQAGYKDISVTHDYPWYSESYEGKTFIKFKF